MNEYHRIIFVSRTGNCREPMAMGIMKAMKPDPSIQILARGLVVQFPEPMNQKAEAVLAAKKCSVPGFSSQQLVREDIDDRTLVLAMEASNYNRIRELFPDVDPAQISVLSTFVGDELEVLDPYGLALANYGLCYENLKRSVEKLIRILNISVDTAVVEPKEEQQ